MILRVDINRCLANDPAWPQIDRRAAKFEGVPTAKQSPNWSCLRDYRFAKRHKANAFRDSLPSGITVYVVPDYDDAFKIGTICGIS